MKSIFTRVFLVATIVAAALPAWAQNKRQALHTMTTAVRCSYAEPGHPTQVVNDGLSTQASGYWSSYRGRDSFGELAYIEYNWSGLCSISRTTVKWKESGDSIAIPTEAYLMTWDGHAWQRAADIAEPNAATISTNTELGLTTNRLRLYMRSDVACGVIEFTVQGYPLDDCAAPRLKAAAEKITIQPGETTTLEATLTLPDGDDETPNWYWLDEQGEVVSTEPTREVGAGGFYTLCYERPCGAVATVVFTVLVAGEYDPRIGYQWPAYSPTLDYDFRSEYPNLPPPSKGPLPEDVGVARRVNGEWWSVAVGPNANPLITEESMRLLAKKMDEDFAYFRNEMGWPPDKRARNGYYSQVYGYGSGLSFDAGTPNTATGGWQSATTYNGSSWPMVFLSYYPIYSFDPKCTYGDRVAQQNACVHEGIHATFADLEGCKQSAWFHEGGNTWLQGEAEVRKSGREPESMGFLSAGNMIAPFMPIECYSGWLQDDSFGGPSAEGVNMYSGGQQVCTWRNLLGGVQYGELFPHFCSEILGKGSIPWIWRYCKKRVLQGMAEGCTEGGKKIPGLGDKQMRSLILEYRARQAMIDVGMWSKACEQLLDANWQLNVISEAAANRMPTWLEPAAWKATPYAKMTAIANPDSTGWWRPEWRTTPGWSGANQVVLHTSARAGDVVSITFRPFTSNMVCMLCYRSESGKIYYGQPFESRRRHNVEVSMLMPEKPANGVVMAIICNTDYVYEGETTRKTHHNYHLKMGQNAWQPATPTLKWYKWSQTIKDPNFNYTGIDEMTAAATEAAVFAVKPARTIVRAGERLPLSITCADRLQVPVQICSSTGAVVYQQSFMRDGELEVPSSLRPGIYILRAFCGSKQATARVLVQ